MLRKPGKNDYSESKIYYFIALLNILGKILKLIIIKIFINIVLINISEHFLIRFTLKNRYNINKIDDLYGIPAFILYYGVVSLSNIKKKFIG